MKKIGLEQKGQKRSEMYFGMGVLEHYCGFPEYHEFIIVLYMYVHRHMHAA